MTTPIEIGARTNLVRFLTESLGIEGIYREPTEEEIAATERFLALDIVCVDDMEALVKVYQPDAVLRDKRGLNVRVGKHVAPRGGAALVDGLDVLLGSATLPESHPHQIHVEYELLHPFTDGNGRSGRALWLWMMLRRDGRIPSIGFLHSFYYQTLERAR